MNEERRKAGVAFWPTVALVAVLAAYPLSFGPWYYAKGRWGDTWVISAVHVAFVPVECAMKLGPDSLTEAYSRYLVWCITSGKQDKHPLHD